jgi:hypothetical protein
VDDAVAFRSQARERGVLLSGSGGRIRAVTHLDASSADVDAALDRLKPLAPGR